MSVCLRSCRQRMRLQPQRAGSDGWINAGLFPPCGFIATAMDLAMMASAQRHGELIAHLAAERAMLREAQMMGVCRPAAANQARLFGHEPDVLLVTKAARLGMGQLALVDAVGNGCLRRAPLAAARATRAMSGAADRRATMAGSPTSAALSSAVSLAWNASSTCRASAAVKLFLAPRIRWAQMAASSDEAIALSSPRSWSRNMADASAPRIGFVGFETTFAPRRPGFGNGSDRRSAGHAYSAPVLQLPMRTAYGALRSGASMSSSPAMPTNVKSA